MKKGFDKKSIWQKYVPYKKLRIVISKKVCISMFKSSLGFHNKECEPCIMQSLDQMHQLPKPTSS